MFVARWHITARFGHRQKAIDLLRAWASEIGPKAGLDPGSVTMLSVALGARESEILSEMKVKDLAELDGLFSKLGQMPEHAAWGEKLEPHIVSGSNHWEVLRVIE